MNRLISVSGAIVILSGFAMYFLLIQLGVQTFRGDIPSWSWGALLLIGVGATTLLGGIALPNRRFRTLDAETAGRYFAWASVFNTVAATVFVFPILIPALEFPILITRWPGIYMVVAYFAFLVIGILGSFAWSILLGSKNQTLGSVVVNRSLFIFHFFATQVGVYLLSVFMFWGGYVGSSFNYQGFGDTVVGSGMEFSVIPSALGIFLVILGNLIGVSNTLLSRSSV